MKKLLYFSVKPIISNIVNNCNLDSITLKKFNHCFNNKLYLFTSSSSKVGQFHNFFNIHIEERHRLPTPDKSFNLSFEECAKIVSQRLENLLEKKNKSLLIYWSGGIDSTLILSAIIKNFNERNLKNITIALNSASFIENPLFYNNIIKDKFKTINTNNKELLSDPWKKYLIVDCDSFGHLLYGDCSIYQIMLVNKIPNFNIIKDNDASVDFLKKVIGKNHVNIQPQNHHATYLLDICSNTAKFNGLNLEYISEILWWRSFNFNLGWEWWMLYNAYATEFTKDNYNSYIENTFNWGTQPEYYQYSMSQKTHFPKNIESVKLDAKTYIYKLDKNLMYFKNKVKLLSSFSVLAYSPQPIAIFDDGTILHEKDTAEIGKIITKAMELYEI